MLMFEGLFALISLFFVGISGYLVILTVAAFSFKKTVGAGDEPQKLAVVIPAHNEALQIGATLAAIRRSSHPESAYAVIVIADNCDDETAAEARAAGAEVVERSDPLNRGKGQALDWFLRNHGDMLSPLQGVAIVDADTFIDVNFLEEISRSLSHPDVKAVQGYYGVANAEESWRTALMAAALAAFHHVRPAGRNRLHGSAGLKGNGMAFRTEVLTAYGWPAHSVVEDLEFGTRLLLDGIDVHYNPDAVVLAEMAATRKQAETQRRRWEGGRLEIFRRFAVPLLKASVSRRRFRYFDGFMDLFIPPLSALVLALGTLLACALLICPAMAGVLLLSMAGIVFYVLSGLVLRRAPLAVWLYLLAAPFFVLWKIPLYLGMFKRRGAGEWVRTQRKAELQKKD